MVQQMFHQTLMQYQQIQAQMQMQQMELSKQRIPTGGTIVGCDLRVPDPASKTGKSKRAQFPTQALEWLGQQLQAQGVTQDKMQGIQMADRQMIDKMASMKAQQMQGQGPQGPPGMGPPGPPPGPPGPPGPPPGMPPQ